MKVDGIITVDQNMKVIRVDQNAKVDQGVNSNQNMKVGQNIDVDQNVDEDICKHVYVC